MRTFSLLSTLRHAVRGALGLLPLALGLGMALPAHAESGFDANRYTAPPLPSDSVLLLRPDNLAGGTLALNVAVSHADDALIGKTGTGRNRQILDEQLWLYAFLAYGLTDWLSVHGTLPVIIRQVGEIEEVEDLTTGLRSGGVGDLKVGARLTLPTFGLPLGLALDGSLFFPTGSRAAFASDGKVRVQVTAIGEVALPLIYVGANLGVMSRPEIEVAGRSTGTLLQLGAGGGIRLPSDLLRVGVEANAQIPTARSGSSWEALAVAKLKIWRLHVAAGAGPGIGSGWQTPDFRAVARVGWQVE